MNKKNFLKISGLVVVIAILIFSLYKLLIPGISTLPTPIVIKLSGWGASPTEQELLTDVLKDEEAKHPAIKVKYEVIADQYMDVIKTRLIGTVKTEADSLKYLSKKSKLRHF